MTAASSAAVPDSSSATPWDSITPTGPASSSSSASPTSSESEGKTDAATVAKVTAAAEKAVNGGKAFEINRKDGSAGWEVKLAVGNREREVEVSADGSKVTPRRRDEGLDRSDRDRFAQVKVPLKDGVRTALKEVNGALDSAELDTENGVVVWEVDIDQADNTSVDVYVNARNGSILEFD